jgi:protein-disulfide isomerase
MARRLLVTAAAASLLSLLGISAEAAPRRGAAAPARTDWTRNIAATPQGGYRMGNPAAPVKLVEYGSISCPHCAHFAAESERLRSVYVKSGKVSFEYRPYLLFPTDPGIFMLLRCQGASGFFGAVDRLYADQPAWEGKLRALTPDRITQINAMTPKARIAALVQASGVDGHFRQRGMAPARIQACLADDRNLNALVAITERGNKEGVQGTPTFFINGKKAEAGDWQRLEPLIKSAGG